MLLMWDELLQMLLMQDKLLWMLLMWDELLWMSLMWDETPISSVHHVAVTVPSFLPLNTKRVVQAVEAQLEAEVEG